MWQIETDVSNISPLQRAIHFTVHSEEWPRLEMSVFTFLYGGQFTMSSQIIINPFLCFASALMQHYCNSFPFIHFELQLYTASLGCTVHCLLGGMGSIDLQRSVGT